ncbi:hypothetical protein, partial [Novipirellula maiorica]|uniref:hypothetical protein n=1 Tax=Novipirellula maiorica TaxID=1265734 RepID=UPI001360B696
ISALLFLSVLAFVYHVLVVAWLRPPEVERVVLAPAREFKVGDTLADLFPEGAWQREKCKRLQTADGMLLFQNWEQSSPDQWKLWPMTVVIGRGMKSSTSESPVVIEANEGAEIKFTGSLDVMSGGAPPIQRGRMMGVVQITRQNPTTPSQSLSIRTANVGIDNQKIWTTEAIQMNLGKARMLGRDLTIHLATNTSAPMAASGKTAVLDRMELIYLEEFRMPLENGGLWPAATTTAPPQNNVPVDPTSMLTQIGGATAPTTDATAEIQLQCDGRLEYDFAIDQLMLRDSVSLIHQIDGAKTDRFDCDTIELTFRDPSNKSIVRTSALDWLHRIKATGAPLAARLPNLDLEIYAGQIDMQASKGLVRADGIQGIEVHRGGIHARLESIVYQFDPASPGTLGAIDARGIGIVTLDTPDVPLRRIQWREGFKMQPLGPIRKDSIDSNIGFWIDGEVKMALTDGGEFQSDSVEGVLKPDPRKTANDDGNAMIPEQLAALGNVHLDTSSIQADTDQLRLFFVEPEPKNIGMIEGNSEEAPSSIRQLVKQPEPGTTTTQVPVARSRPSVQGNTITAKLVLDDGGVHAQDLSVVGSVHLTHTVQLGGQPMLAKLTGEQLRLIDGGGEDVLQLGSGVGAPARFEIGDGYFVGPLIQIRPSDNIIWINEAGEFRIPSQALPNDLADGLTGGSAGTAAGTSNTATRASQPSGAESKLTWTEPPLCRWQGEMVFDGKTATLTDGVEITASLVNGREPWDVHVAGDRMEIILHDGVQVRDLKTMKTATVQRIDLLQSDSRPLMIQAVQRAPDGLTESKHLLHAEKLTLVPSGGGKLFGAGPGWYRCWTRGDQSGLKPGGSAKPTVPSNLLTGIHLIFNDTMQGDILNKSLDFMRGVRVGVRDVASWDDTFDAQTMDALSAGQTTLDCDHLRIGISPEAANRPSLAGLPTPWETEAVGGVIFRTRNERGLLECSATRAAYSAAKDMFTMHGAPNRPALFRQQLPDGQPGPEGAVKSMSLKLKTMEVENLQLERLSIAAPPGMAAPQ